METELKAAEALSGILKTPGGEALQSLLMMHIDSAVNRIMDTKCNLEMCRISGEIRFARSLLASMTKTIDVGKTIRHEKHKAIENTKRKQEDQLTAREHRRGGPVARRDAIG